MFLLKIIINQQKIINISGSKCLGLGRYRQRNVYIKFSKRQQRFVLLLPNICMHLLIIVRTSFSDEHCIDRYCWNFLPGSANLLQTALRVSYSQLRVVARIGSRRKYQELYLQYTCSINLRQQGRR